MYIQPQLAKNQQICWLSSSLVEVTWPDLWVVELLIKEEESYIGLTDNTFKTRYNGHTSSFRNEQYRNATTLSNYIWTLKDKNINYSLKWKIIDRGRTYQPSGKSCGLCDLEMFYIISRPELASLNQRMNSLPLADIEKNTYSATNKLILTQVYNHSLSPLMSNSTTHNYLWWVEIKSHKYLWC